MSDITEAVRREVEQQLANYHLRQAVDVLRGKPANPLPSILHRLGYRTEIPFPIDYESGAQLFFRKPQLKHPVELGIVPSFDPKVSKYEEVNGTLQLRCSADVAALADGNLELYKVDHQTPIEKQYTVTLHPSEIKDLDLEHVVKRQGYHGRLPSEIVYANGLKVLAKDAWFDAHVARATYKIVSAAGMTLEASIPIESGGEAILIDGDHIYHVNLAKKDTVIREYKVTPEDISKVRGGKQPDNRPSAVEYGLNSYARTPYNDEVSCWQHNQFKQLLSQHIERRPLEPADRDKIGISLSPAGGEGIILIADGQQAIDMICQEAERLLTESNGRH